MYFVTQNVMFPITFLHIICQETSFLFFFSCVALQVWSADSGDKTFVFTFTQQRKYALDGMRSVEVVPMYV